MSDRRAGPVSESTGSDEGGGDRALGAGVAAFVAIHLLALLAVGEPSLPELLGVEVVGVGLLLAGDAVATGLRIALPAAVGVLAALALVWMALGPLEMPPWAVAVGLLVVTSAALYAGHSYDRSLAGGEPA